MKRKTILIAVGVLVLGGVAAAAFVKSTGEEELLEVQTADVSLETIVQKVNATGRIQPKTQIRISADVSAKIIALHVEEGDFVQEGQLLVELDRERFEAAMESTEATVRSTQSNARLNERNMLKAEKDLDRSRDLVSRNLESQAVLDTDEAEYEVEVARYQSSLDLIASAEASLKQAAVDLSKTTIYAPMTGTISVLDKEQGEIAIGSAFQEDIILVVADLTEMEAQVNVDENDIVGVQIGQIASIKVDALFGDTLTGTVYEISNTANTDESGGQSQKTEFEVKISIDGEITNLRPGMTASADVSTETKADVVGVPIQSVAVRTIDQLTLEGEEVADAEKRFTADDDGFVEIVFSVESDGSVVARQVETGIQSDQMIEIVSGIDADEEVVTGSYRAISTDLQNGAQVDVNNDEDGDSNDA
jgi:HlyD family secretion protein